MHVEELVVEPDCKMIFFNSANTNSAFNAACLKALAHTHLKLHAFTLAEYCYVTSKTENIDLVRCLVEQRNPLKCKEALWLTGVMESTAGDEVKAELIELEAKCVHPFSPKDEIPFCSRSFSLFQGIFALR